MQKLNSNIPFTINTTSILQQLERSSEKDLVVVSYDRVHSIYFTI